MITNEALVILRNNITFTRSVQRTYDDQFARRGAKIGTTLNVRKPVRYIGTEGPALTTEDITETSVPVVLNHQWVVGITFTSSDLELKIGEFSKRLIQPAVATIANKIDNLGLAQYTGIANFAGAPGTVPQNLDIYLNAQAALNNSATPMDGQRYVVITPLMEATIVFALKGLFQSSTQIKEQYEKGQMGRAAGFDWSMDQNIATHVVGNAVGTPLSNGATQTGASIITDGWTATTATLKVGDIIDFAGVFQVNPQSRQSTGVLQPFVVTADVTADGGGNITVAIYPSIVTSGAAQTVTTSVADGSAIRVFGTAQAGLAAQAGKSTPQALAYHPDAFTLACADLPLPDGVDMASRAADKDVGLSVRMVRQYDIQTDKWPCRIDVLFGWATLRPELACRICS
jgi:hypothetical protein